jgi:hypothetical protein
MKVLTKWLCAGVFVAFLAGCASDVVYVPELPTHAKTLYMEYQSQPGNKVFVVAVDPNGDFAVGYDSGKATTKEAYEAALAQCNENRKAYGVLNAPHVYAINDKVVYEQAIQKSMARN